MARQAKKSLTNKQALLARVYARTGSIALAEREAGYHKNGGYRALKMNPEIAAQVSREQMYILRTTGVMVAVAALIDVASDPEERGSSRAAASKIILEYTEGKPDSNVSKALEQMTDAELMEALQAAKARRSELAVEVLEAEATTIDIPAQPGAGALD